MKMANGSNNTCPGERISVGAFAHDIVLSLILIVLKIVHVSF